LLGSEAIHSLIDLLFREFIKIKRNNKVEVQPVPPQTKIFLSREQREKTYKKFCSRCHGVAGNGRGSEYLKYLPRPRDLTNHPYFRKIDDGRIGQAIYSGVPGTGMGAFSARLSSEIIGSLVKKIRDFSRTKEGGSN
jgi:mono/diheme cytochrome c family protein